jgi:hypothetical protein
MLSAITLSVATKSIMPIVTILNVVAPVDV